MPAMRYVDSIEETFFLIFGINVRTEAMIAASLG